MRHEAWQAGRETDQWRTCRVKVKPVMQTYRSTSSQTKQTDRSFIPFNPPQFQEPLFSLGYFNVCTVCNFNAFLLGSSQQDLCHNCENRPKHRGRHAVSTFKDGNGTRPIDSHFISYYKIDERKTVANCPSSLAAIPPNWPNTHHQSITKRTGEPDRGSREGRKSKKLKPYRRHMYRTHP